MDCKQAPQLPDRHLELNDEEFFNFGTSLTEVFGINNNDIIVGIYDDAGEIFMGFYQHPRRDNPLTIQVQSDPSRKINDSGLVVGSYFDATGIPHGFSFKDGQYSPIDFPGAFDTARMV